MNNIICFKKYTNFIKKFLKRMIISALFIICFIFYDYENFDLPNHLHNFNHNVQIWVEIEYISQYYEYNLCSEFAEYYIHCISIDKDYNIPLIKLPIYLYPLFKIINLIFNYYQIKYLQEYKFNFEYKDILKKKFYKELLFDFYYSITLYELRREFFNIKVNQYMLNNAPRLMNNKIKHFNNYFKVWGVRSETRRRIKSELRNADSYIDCHSEKRINISKKNFISAIMKYFINFCILIFILNKTLFPVILDLIKRVR